MNLATLSAILVTCNIAQSKFEPTGSYEKITVNGFKILVSKHARAAKEEYQPAMALLKLRLSEIERLVPKEALSKIQKIPIWIEQSDPKVPCMCYHVDKGWLTENGLNPDKEKSVELANLKNFVKWSFDQPLMVLHEMAHGYHDLYFGYQEKSILDAYNAAMKSHLYDEVSYFRSNKRKAYATTNQMEYFAELTEALFGYNDFFPFTRPELEAHDPTGFKVLKEAWGVKN